MLIKAKYDGNKVLLNTDYIIDVWDIDKPFCKAYVCDSERGEYTISQSDLQKLIDYSNNAQEVKLIEEVENGKDN